MSDSTGLFPASRRVVYYRRLALAVVLIALLGLLHEYNPTRPPVYRATATLQMDVTPISEASIVSAEALDRKDLETARRLNTLAATMPNTALMRNVIEEHGLLNSLDSTDGGLDAREMDSLVLELMSTVRSSVRKGTHLVDISVTHGDQKFAENLANWVSVGMIQQDVDRKFAGRRSAFDVLAREVEKLKTQRNEAESALMDFRERLNLAIPMEEQELVLKRGLEDLRQQATDLSILRDRLESDLRMVAQFGEKPTLDRLEGVVSIYDAEEVRRIRDLIAEHREALLLIENDQEDWLTAHNLAADTLQEQYVREVRKAASGLKMELERLGAKEEGLKRQTVKAEAEMLAFADRRVEYDILARDVAASALLYESVADRVEEFDLSEGLGDAALVLVQEARDATDVSREPNLRRLVLLGCMIGASGFFLIDLMGRLFR